MVKGVIFASGNGSNAQAILDAKIQGLEIVLIVCDHQEAYVVERARQSNVRCEVVERKEEMSKEEHEGLILNILKEKEIEIVLLAGYMRILSSDFIQSYPNRILNIHPSLLPKYQGKSAMKRAWDSSDEYLGVSVHYVDEGIDTGVLLEQGILHRSESKDYEAYCVKLHALEHELYPKVIEKKIREIEYEKSIDQCI